MYNEPETRGIRESVATAIIVNAGMSVSDRSMGVSLIMHSRRYSASRIGFSSGEANVRVHPVVLCEILTLICVKVDF